MRSKTILVALCTLFLTACGLFAPNGHGPATPPSAETSGRPDVPDATGGLSPAAQLYAKAYVLWGRGEECSDPEKAIALLNSALDIDPDHADALFLRGMAFRQLGHPEEAFNNISKAISIGPRPKYYAWRAYLLMGEGNMKGAELDLAHARELDTDDRELIGIEGVHALATGDEKKACTKFREAARRGIPSWLAKARSDSMCH